MKLCIPVEEDRGLESPVCGHFGSAPCFLIVDTENRSLTPVANGNLHHAHGMCQPLRALQGHPVEAVVVGGIGMGALLKLQAGGIRVYRALHPSVEATLDAFDRNELQEISRQETCGGHSHGLHGCSH